MSDDGFLKRWSRKKRTEPPAADAESVEAPPSDLPPPAGRSARPHTGLRTDPSAGEGPQAGEGFENAPSPAERGKAGMGVAPQAPSANTKQDDDAIDPATLPPIESLGADSDYTVFLRKGVPEALRIAALRKAWASDPFIRDFRSPAIDYGWDFTTPEFDLRPTDDVAKMLDRIFPPKAPESEQPAEPAAPANEAPKIASRSDPPAPELRLPQKQAEPPVREPARDPAPAEPALPRRKHGGALPDEPIDNS